MAHYYIQSLDDNIKLYTDVQVLHVAGDDVGVSNPNRAQQIVMDESQQILLQNEGGPQQVVYQAQATPTQYQPPQPGQHYTILGDDISQPQAQQVHQQTQQQQPQQQQQPPPSPQHQQQQQQQQQVLMHQQQQTQQHQVLDHQQNQMQTAYQIHDPQQQQQQQQQQHMQPQEHQMQHVQAGAQQQATQIYYTTESMVQQQQQQQQKKLYIQQQAPQTMQQQYQPHPQQQQHQQMMHSQTPPHQQQTQQHILQSPQHQQVQVQHQVSPSTPQQQPQIIYRMQPPQSSQQMQQSSQLLGNTQLIVQQPSGQQVLIQQQPQQSELLMRQPRVVYGNTRVLNFTPTQQQQQQQAIMQQSPHQQQSHIQLHHTPTTHLVQQARVVTTQQHAQSPQQHTPSPPTQLQQQQQMQQNVVYHQIQVPNSQLVAKQNPHPQHIQLQQQQQQSHQQSQMVGQLVNPNGTTIIRTTGVRGGKVTRGAGGTLVTRLPGMSNVARFNAAATSIGGGGQILRTPRPRCSTTAGTTTRGRGGRGGRGAAAAAAGRNVQLATMTSNSPQLATLQQGKVLTQGPGIRQVYRTTDASGVQQQIHLVQTPRMPGTAAARFRTQTVGVQQAQIQQQQQQQGAQQSSSPAPATGGGNFELDLEDSIQAVFVKKEGQKPSPSGVISSPNPHNASNSPGVPGTTVTTYYTAATATGAKETTDEDTQLVKTQNGAMTLAEYRKRYPNASVNQIVASPGAGFKPLQQIPGGAKISLPAAGQSLPSVPVARVAPQKHIVTKEQVGGTVVTATAANPMPNRPAVGSSVYQTSHNNYEIQTQHVLQNRLGQQMAEKDRNSAKMLVILVSGEQRLITFTLPRESCTVQDLLEQVGVPFDDNTTIQCVENPGANIDFVVTVGFSVQESASELISRAEQSLQISRQQESLQQNAAATSTAAATNAVENAAQQSTAQQSTASTTTATTPAVSSAAASESSSPARSDNSTKEQAAGTTTAKLAAISNAKVSEEVTQRKLIQGFYAICQSCGFSGYDHSKCERCKRVFHEPPKKIPIKHGNSSAGMPGNFANINSALNANEIAHSLPMEKKMRHASEGPPAMTNQRGKSSYNPNAAPTRGRGGASHGGRGRGTRSGRRAAEAEPVILTLSSDEEDDESSNKASSHFGHFAKSANSSPPSLMNSFKPMSFEPNLPEKDETIIYSDFKRGDVTDLSECSDQLSCKLACKLIRLGTYSFESPEEVIITSRGIRLVAPLETNPTESFPLHIFNQEIVKVIGHFSKVSESMLCFYTLRNCAQYIRTSLKMPEITQPVDGIAYFSPHGPYHVRRIILQCQTITDEARSVIRSIWDFLDEISETDAQDLLQRAAESDRKLADSKSNSESVAPTTTQIQATEIRQLLIYPPGKGGISINTEDYLCLATDQYLNDIIIDFYLKWVHDHIIQDEQKERTHIFSTFFYKRLTTMSRHINHDKEVKQTAAQKRHARVQNWTKNVNLFEKDFIIIPINEQSHWFLAIICFPRFKGPVTFDTNVPVELQPIKKARGKKVSLQIGNTTITPLSKRDSANVLSEICGVGDEDSERDEAEGDESDLASEDSDFENSSSNTTSNSQPAAATTTPLQPTTNTPTTTTTSSSSTTSTPTNTANNSASQPIKQPLILIFDSLAGASRSRVVATLRDYLTCEFKIKMPEAATHIFNKDNMPGHCVKVPQQNNFTDCGLYLLQYVEQFFKDPIRDYRVPIKQLANWFDTLTVTKKREDISNLLQTLMDERNGPNKMILPEIPFPTLNGQLVEPADGYNIEFEEEEMEDDDDDENQTGDMDDISTDDTSKSKTPIKIHTQPVSSTASTTTTTVPALVPTQGRKIVLKRRMQVPGATTESNSSSPSIVNATSSSCPTQVTTTGSQQRTTNVTKIRKVEQ